MTHKFTFPLLIALISITAACTASDSDQKSNSDESTSSQQESLAGSNLSPASVGVQKVDEQPLVENAYFIDPTHGDSSNEGTENSPWKSLQSVIDRRLIESQQWDSYPYEIESSYLVPKNQGAQIVSGSTIYLKNGHYGHINIRGYYNAEPITIKAYPGHTPVFDSINITAGMNWVFDSIKIVSPKEPVTKTLFDAITHSYHGPVSNIKVINSHITSSEDVSQWSIDDWSEKALNGVDSDANNFTLKNNLIENIAIGVMTLGDNSIVEQNTINSFSRDGIRPLGNYNVVQFNLIKNSIFLDNGHHDDAIQSFTTNEQPLRGSVIHSNIIMAYDNTENRFIDEQKLQGIGLFDGPFIDWIISDNIIMVDNWHGISIYDSKDSSITNNSVIDPDYSNNISPRAMLGTKDKNGDMSITGNVISHNIVSKTASVTEEELNTGNTFENNYTGQEKVTPEIFIDYNNYDFRLSEDGINTVNQDLNGSSKETEQESANDEEENTSNSSKEPQTDDSSDEESNQLFSIFN